MGALTRTHGAAADPATSRGSSGSKAANLTARTFEQLRDYFATQVSAQVSDPKIVMNLMRHTSLNTTTLYTRTVTERMKAAVRSKLGGRSWGISLRRKTRNNTMRELLLKVAERNAKLLNERNVEDNFDDVELKSGGRSRT
ncbi:MAG TPA: hypothetical protein VK603_06405 [Candidatus Saccharimonadales bacterium]|nr:hypothetical protein [Candidatus Saccharimonadales bacterium]